ncbi:hypothetical protein N658DRAFT_52759 [Parathielavia hyrcaniae]|uniref:Uncharacterized protein n=1 Tax=Parathielavia hyrcaniae TaxID=113614 RepID=A0AAN6Q2Q3_9PEZI|nr:hypothetical protein N658DRAFT_52759 [Parathielavia hyrcaniae]
MRVVERTPRCAAAAAAAAAQELPSLPTTRRPVSLRALACHNNDSDGKPWHGLESHQMGSTTSHRNSPMGHEISALRGHACIFFPANKTAENWEPRANGECLVAQECAARRHLPLLPHPPQASELSGRPLVYLGFPGRGRHLLADCQDSSWAGSSLMLRFSTQCIPHRRCLGIGQFIRLLSILDDFRRLPGQYYGHG